MNIRITELDRERFETKVDRSNGPDACHTYIGGRQSNGLRYGAFWVDGRNRGAHIVAYLLAGGTIEQGKLICHHCDNPICVNPLHLYQGTPAQNMADRRNRGRVPKGEQHHNAVLSDERVLDIRFLYSTGQYSLNALARMFGVSRPTIKSVVDRVTWAHI